MKTEVGMHRGGCVHPCVRFSNIFKHFEVVFLEEEWIK